MAFEPKTREQIRDDVLAARQAAYADAGITLCIDVGSQAWLEAEADSFLLYELHAIGMENVRNADPTQAVGTALTSRWATVAGLTPEAATRASLVVTITGTPGASTSWTTAARLVWQPTGVAYAPRVLGCTFNGGGAATITVDAVDAGAAQNRNPGDTLVWASTPTSTNPLATCGSTSIIGADAESETEFRERVVLALRERPGSGNRSDFRAWIEAFDGIDDAFVFPLLDATFGPGVPGSVLCVALGPAQGEGATNTRIVGGGTGGKRLDGTGGRPNVEGYLMGTHDAHGAAVTNGTALLPVTMQPTNATVWQCGAQSQVVQIAVRTADDHPYVVRRTFGVSSTTWAGSGSFDVTLDDSTSWIPSPSSVWIRAGSQLRACRVIANVSPTLTIAAGHGLTSAPTEVLSFGPWALLSTTWSGAGAFDIIVDGTLDAATNALVQVFVAAAIRGLGRAVVADITPDAPIVGQSTISVHAGHGLPSAPVISVITASDLDAAVRLAVFEYFDQLGPGDTDPPTRYPPPSQFMPSVLRQNALEAAVIFRARPDCVVGVDGVLDCHAALPSSDVTPAARYVVTLDGLIITPPET